MRPSIMPKLSWRTLVTGARQLVVQEAFDTNCMSALYLSLLTPITNIGVSSFEGADITTRFAPALIWPSHDSFVRKRPVDSQTYSAPTASHLRLAWSFSPVTRFFLPFTIRSLPEDSTVPLNTPCTESYLSI